MHVHMCVCMCVCACMHEHVHVCVYMCACAHVQGWEKGWVGEGSYHCKSDMEISRNLEIWNCLHTTEVMTGRQVSQGKELLSPCCFTYTAQ